MRTILLASALLILSPSLNAAPIQDKQPVARSDDQPSGDRYEDRWQGRQHILYDELWQDGTDGSASNAKSECRSYSLRFKRPDGTTGVRRENRCN